MKLISKELLITLIDYFEGIESYETADILAECLLTDAMESERDAENFSILEHFFDSHYDPDTQEQYFECVTLPAIRTVEPLTLADYLEFAKLRGEEWEYDEH